MILKLILFLIFVYFGIKTVLMLVRYVRNVRSDNSQMHNSRHAPLNEMVKDPVCGTYIVKKGAICCRTQQGIKYFCSEECKNKFLGKQTRT